MKELTPSTPLVILYSEHPLFGALLIPYTAESGPDGQLRLTEQAFHASSNTIEQMSEAEQKAIHIASHYTEKYLMQVYSREKTVARFLQKLSNDPERIKESIRPYIEKKLKEMTEAILEGNLPLYQKPGSSKLLFPHHAYRVHREPVRTSFTFKVDGEFFSYYPDCLVDGQTLVLSEPKPVVTLVSSPAVLLLGMNLYRFHHIEASRLLPFTNKKTVSVPSRLLPKYIENIVIPIARYHTVETDGLALIEESPMCEALLSIEEGISNGLLLLLTFRYGSREFTPEESPEIKIFLPRRDDEEETVLRYFRRNRQAEESLVRRLLDSGMQQVGESHFGLADGAPEKSLGEWLTCHREMIEQHFRLTDALSERSYCLDEVRIEQNCDDGPDWFDLHITVVVGEFRIPFNRFRKHILEEKREFILPDGRLLLLPEEWFARYANLMELGETGEKSIRLRRHFAGIVSNLLDEPSQLRLPNAVPITELPPPNGLKATLRPYQQKGYAWMVHLYENDFGGCLADDMGLGKTLQTLTLLQYIYRGTASNHLANEVPADAGRSTPNTPHIDEIGQFSLFGEESFREVSLSDEPSGNGSFNNDLFSNEPGSNNLFGNDLFGEALPEQPASGNPTTTAQPSARKPATLIVVPTSLLHNWRKETRRFTNLSITEYNTQTRFRKGQPELFFKQYHLILTSYGMMRNNTEVLNRYCFEYVVLDESQNIKNSDSLTFRAATQLRCNHRLVLTGTPIENSLKDLWSQFHFLQPGLLGSESEFNKRFIAPIRQNDPLREARLRQLISPFILRRSKREVAPELPSLTEEIIYCDMSDEQDSLYQQEKNSLRNTLLQSHLPGNSHQSLTILNGITRLRQLACHPQMIFPDSIAGSGKLEQIIDTFETLRSEGHKVLIFSAFVKHLELIAAIFRERRWSYALLTGSSTDRAEEIARFTQSDEIQAFLISLKAGGVGLNLTQADYVFIIDPWWNPAAEAQAISRAHRIGQDKQVIAYRFITQGSIEEKITQLQESKRKLANTFIADSDSLPQLTGKEWTELLS